MKVHLLPRAPFLRKLAPVKVDLLPRDHGCCQWLVWAVIVVLETPIALDKIRVVVLLRSVVVFIRGVGVVAGVGGVGGEGAGVEGVGAVGVGAGGPGAAVEAERCSGGNGSLLQFRALRRV